MAKQDYPSDHQRKIRAKQEVFRKAIAEKPAMQREYLAGQPITIH